MNWTMSISMSLDSLVGQGRKAEPALSGAAGWETGHDAGWFTVVDATDWMLVFLSSPGLVDRPVGHPPYSFSPNILGMAVC